MIARRQAGVGLVILALALGCSACGGGTKAPKTSAAQAAAAEARWRAGVVVWHRKMVYALDGLSLIFARQGSLAILAHPKAQMSVRLAGYELTLASCSATMRRLGPVPEKLALADKYALEACKSIEQGEQVVESQMRKLRAGIHIDPDNPVKDASAPLTAGQNEIDTATHVMNASPPGA